MKKHYIHEFISIKHVVLECDGTEQLRVEMYESIQSVTSIDIVNIGERYPRCAHTRNDESMESII